MKKTASTIIITIGMLFSFASCNENTNEHKIKDKSINVITALSNSYINGSIYMKDGVCSFYDYSADESFPLCLKPNCTHEDKGCASKVITSSTGGIEYTVIYNDCIYFFIVEESIEGEGRDTTYEILSTLSKCNLETGEIEDVLEIPDLNCTTSLNMVLNDNMLYFTGSNGAYQFEDGTWMNAGVGNQYLCSINLENNTFENYGLINDNEYVSNNVIITENSINAVSDQVVVSGVFDGEIYFYYSYVEDKNIIIDAIENNNYNIDWKYEVKKFNLKDKSIGIVTEQPPICLNDDWYVTENKSDKKIIARNNDGKTIEFDSVNEFPFDYYQYSIYNDKIFDLYNGVVYDLTTKAMSKIAEDYLGGNITDYLSKEKKYVLSAYDSSGNLIYSKIDEENLIVK